MTQFSARHPILFSILAVLLAVLLIRLLDAGLPYLNLPELANRLITEAVLAVYVIVLLTRLNGWQAAGFQRPVARRWWLAALPLLLLPALVMLTTGLKAAGAAQVIGIALLSLLVGFAEEALLRGVVLPALLPIGLARAVLLSSVLFGVGHLLNLWQGFSPFAIAVQIIYATLLGIGFAGARVYTGSLWPAIAVHALIDLVDAGSRGFVLASPAAPTPASVIAPIVITGLYALYGAWLLRRAAAGRAARPIVIQPRAGRWHEPR